MRNGGGAGITRTPTVVVRVSPARRLPGNPALLRLGVHLAAHDVLVLLAGLLEDGRSRGRDRTSSPRKSTSTILSRVTVSSKFTTAAPTGGPAAVAPS